MGTKYSKKRSDISDLRENSWNAINFTYLKYATWLVLAFVYTCNTIMLMQITNTSWIKKKSFLLPLCDIVIYYKKYTFDLCPYFWHKAPETLGVSSNRRAIEVSLVLSTTRVYVNEVTFVKPLENHSLRFDYQGN